MSTLVSYISPGLLLRLPPSQPSHLKVLTSVSPKELGELPVWVSRHPLRLFYAACSVHPAVIMREAVPMPWLALGEEKGIELLWWVVLKPQANSSSAESAASLQPPHCRLLHTLGPPRGRQTPVCWLGFLLFFWLLPSSSFTTGRKYSLTLTESFLDNTNSPAQPAFFKILKLILLYNPFWKVTLIVLC